MPIFFVNGVFKVNQANSIELVKVSKLTNHPKNANRHTKAQIERLMKLITYQGFRVPIIVSKFSGHIVSGHCRLEAAKKMKMPVVPVIYQDFESAEQEYAFLISDNEIARWAELDVRDLKIEMPNFQIDFDLYGLLPIDLIATKNDIEVKSSDQVEGHYNFTIQCKDRNEFEECKGRFNTGDHKIKFSDWMKDL